MPPLNKAFSTTILCSVLFLTACSNVNQNQTTTTTPNTPATPVTVTDNQLPPASDKAEMMDEDANLMETNEDTESQDTALELNERTQSEVTALSAQFEYNDNQQFLNCGYESLLNCQNQTANQIAVTEKNVNACDSIMDDSQSENCKNQLWNQLAMLENDVTLCEELTDEFQAGNCKNQVSFSMAVTDGDPTKCDTIQDIYQLDECKNQAFVTKAVAELDVNVCENIIMYNYETVLAEAETTEAGEDSVAVDMQEEIVRNAVSDENNIYKQECLSQIQMQQEMQAQEATQAEQDAAFQAEMEAEEAARAEAEAQAQLEAEQNDTTELEVNADTEVQTETENVSEGINEDEMSDELAPVTE